MVEPLFYEAAIPILGTRLTDSNPCRNLFTPTYYFISSYRLVYVFHGNGLPRERVSAVRKESDRTVGYEAMTPWDSGIS
jgi:hypothetical protein